MKRLTVLLTAVIAMLMFICPSFAAGNTGKKELSLKPEASGPLTGKQLRGLQVGNQDHYGLAPAWGVNSKTTAGSQSERFNSETYKDESQNNYGLAPAWGKRNDDTWGKRMLQDQSIDPSSNPSLQNLYDDR